MNRPPPYFPQNQLSPPDEKRYRKFKVIVALTVIGLVLILGAVGYGIYFLITKFFF
jgi:preprotein translocase subunit Sss1